MRQAGRDHAGPDGPFRGAHEDRSSVLRCVDCGGPANAKLRLGQEKALLCWTCIDKRSPADRMGSLTRAFLPDKVDHETCPFCGWTKQRVVNEELLGCPLCYQVFRSSLKMLRPGSTSLTGTGV